MEKEIRKLRDQAIDLAGCALRTGRITLWKTLCGVAEQLTVIPERPHEQPSNVPGSQTEIPIFARYRGTRYEAILSLKQMGTGQRCVCYGGQWHTPSRAAGIITGTMVNGWKWWRWRDQSGAERYIDDLRRKKGNPPH